jgi:hypothetical protein
MPPDHRVSRALPSPRVPLGLVSPAVYQAVVGPDCCQDCWDAHRSFNLPAWMDHACCAGACGVDPRMANDASRVPPRAVFQRERVANAVWLAAVAGLAGLVGYGIGSRA